MRKLRQFYLLLILIGATNLFGQNPITRDTISVEKSTSKEKFSRLEVGVGSREFAIAKYNVHYTRCFPINSKMSWGVGTGLEIFAPNYFLVPLFANFKSVVNPHKTTPYFSLDAGYYLISNDYDHGFLFNPSFGISIKKSKFKSFDIGLGCNFRLTEQLDFYPFRELFFNFYDCGIVCVNMGFTF